MELVYSDAGFERARPKHAYSHPFRLDFIRVLDGRNRASEIHPLISFTAQYP